MGQVRMNRGWWYDRDVGPDDEGRLPFVAGMQPVPATVPATRPPRTTRAAIAPTAELRYHERLALWTGGQNGHGRLGGALAHRGWWLLHNLVAHPLLALWPVRAAVALHDWTSRGLNRDATIEPSPAPEIGERLWWVVHNLMAHPAIALAPARRRSAGTTRRPGGCGCTAGCDAAR